MLTQEIFLILGSIYFVSEILYTVRDVVLEYRENKAQEMFAQDFFSQILSDATKIQDESAEEQEKTNTKKTKAKNK